MTILQYFEKSYESGAFTFCQRLDGLAAGEGLAVVRGDQEDLFGSRLDLFLDQSRFGKWADAEATWQLLDPMGRDWSRATYRPGDAEFEYARFQYWKGRLQEKHLTAAEGLANLGKQANRAACMGSPKAYFFDSSSPRPGGVQEEGL